jgi:hypothetical protein
MGLTLALGCVNSPRRHPAGRFSHGGTGPAAARRPAPVGQPYAMPLLPLLRNVPLPTKGGSRGSRNRAFGLGGANSLSALHCHLPGISRS